MPDSCLNRNCVPKLNVQKSQLKSLFPIQIPAVLSVLAYLEAGATIQQILEKHHIVLSRGKVHEETWHDGSMGQVSQQTNEPLL